jgi:uncharacterized metal-binding protein
MSEKPSPMCATCSIRDRICRSDDGRGPESCPTINYKDVIEKTVKEYDNPEVREFARVASLQEAECYINRDIKPYVLHPVKPRVQEICEFAEKMGYKKLGIAHCAGLHPEARSLSNILTAQGFEPVSVSCKIGCTPKEVLGLKEDEKVKVNEFESMCSPIAQAVLLNEEKTDFNILVGLCVGHDSLFLKYSEAYTTVLVTKDRVLAHNPVAALYTTSTYYARLLRPGIDVPKEKN